MRKIVFASAFLLLSYGFSFAQGIEFNHDNWGSVVAKAKKENKLIFLDAYTSWCGPCKLLQAKVFPDATLGKYFNENFVSTKVDMETGEGPGLAAKYRVRAYPTLFFIDPNNETVVQQVLGYKSIEQLLSIGQSANAKKNI